MKGVSTVDRETYGLLSPFLRRQRYKKVVPYLNGRVLDYGCGLGGLARYVLPEWYCGVEPDLVRLAQARSSFPCHRFSSSPPAEQERFESVVALAVVEHVDNPGEFLHLLSGHLSDSPAARLVITTPHPSPRWVYALGAMLGLFGKHAYKEHVGLLDDAKIKAAGSQAGLRLVSHERFLLGANQLAVFEKVR